jgi:hypothetical protein
MAEHYHHTQRGILMLTALSLAGDGANSYAGLIADASGQSLWDDIRWRRVDDGMQREWMWRRVQALTGWDFLHGALLILPSDWLQRRGQSLCRLDCRRQWQSLWDDTVGRHIVGMQRDRMRHGVQADRHGVRSIKTLNDKFVAMAKSVEVAGGDTGRQSVPALTLLLPAA